MEGALLRLLSCRSLPLRDGLRCAAFTDSCSFPLLPLWPRGAGETLSLGQGSNRGPTDPGQLARRSTRPGSWLPPNIEVPSRPFDRRRDVRERKQENELSVVQAVAQRQQGS